MNEIQFIRHNNESENEFFARVDAGRRIVERHFETFGIEVDSDFTVIEIGQRLRRPNRYLTTMTLKELESSRCQ